MTPDTLWWCEQLDAYLLHTREGPRYAFDRAMVDNIGGPRRLVHDIHLPEFNWQRIPSVDDNVVVGVGDYPLWWSWTGPYEESLH